MLLICRYLNTDQFVDQWRMDSRIRGNKGLDTVRGYWNGGLTHRTIEVYLS